MKHKIKWIAIRQQGLTLMELMIAVALSALVLAALSGFTSLMWRAVQQDARLTANRELIEQVTQRIRLELNEAIGLETATEQRFTYTTSLTSLNAPPSSSSGATLTPTAYVRSDVQCEKESDGDGWRLVYRSFPVSPNTQGPIPVNVAEVPGAKAWVLYEHLESCQMSYGSMPLPNTAAGGLMWQSDPGVARPRDLVFVRVQVAYEAVAPLPVLFARVQMMR